jgi:poly-gamma-glutamate synthesis protein (capsule biosynthesis protein)
MNEKFEKLILPVILLFLLFNFLFTLYYFVGFNRGKEPISAIVTEPSKEVLSEGSGRDKIKKTVKIIFTGDLMMDRYIRSVGEKKGYDFIFNDIKDDLGKVDHVITNLEGPITQYDSVSINTDPGTKENYIFTMSNEILDGLYDSNIKIFNIGNNHIFNFGKDGFDQTINNLNDKQLKYFGDLSEVNDITINPLILDNGEFIINIFNYNQFGGKDADAISEDIKYHDTLLNINIVYAHWGEEYEEKSNEKIREIAEKFIDNGADLVIGSHPHVIQNIDEYKDKKIFYSLGNFVMDQYFEENVRKGLLVYADITLEGIETYTKIIYLNADGSTAFYNENTK